LHCGVKVRAPVTKFYLIFLLYYFMVRQTFVEPDLRRSGHWSTVNKLVY
jgi:hypothetical protein